MFERYNLNMEIAFDEMDLLLHIVEFLDEGIETISQRTVHRRHRDDVSAEDGIVQRVLDRPIDWSFCIFELEMMYFLVLAFQQSLVFGHQERNPLLVASIFITHLNHSFTQQEHLFLLCSSFTLFSIRFFDITSIRSFLGTKKGQ